MKCLVLAAGYATRLYPLTENFPKPLLEVRGKSILSWLLDDVESTCEISSYLVVSNHKFVKHFEEWKKQCPYGERVQILDDGSTENENRLGAVRDIAFAVNEANVDEELMVLAGDNLLDFSLGNFARFYARKTEENGSCTCIMRHEESELAKLQRTGVAEVDATDRVISMEEKPQVPKSHWAVPPFYIYSMEDLKKIQEGIDGGCNTDAPGSFIAWLCGVTKVFAYEMPGGRYDIGNLESYEIVNREYKGIIG